MQGTGEGSGPASPGRGGISSLVRRNDSELQVQALQGNLGLVLMLLTQLPLVQLLETCLTVWMETGNHFFGGSSFVDVTLSPEEAADKRGTEPEQNQSSQSTPTAPPSAAIVLQHCC